MTFSTLEPVVLTLINAGGLFLIIVVLANSFNEKLYRWFVVMTILLMGWVNFAYLGYSESSINSAITAYRLNLAFVAAFFFAAYAFYIECFLKINKPIFRATLFLISGVFVILSLFTNTIIDGAITRDWGNEIHFGSIYPAFSVFSAVMAIVFMYYFISRYFTLPSEERKKIIFFLIGTFFFIIFNVTFNILTTTFLNTAEYQHYGDYSAIIFLIFTVFAVVGRKFLNVKVALAAFVISAMSILLLFNIITTVPQEVKMFMFGVFIILSVILMRSVINEIKSKQQLFDLASEQKDIIDVMGHEIRTPLTAIIQAIKVLKKYVLPIEEKLMRAAQASSEQELPKALTLLFDETKTADRATTKANMLVTDMLETARLDKQRFELNYEQFDLVSVVRSSVELMSKTVEGESEPLKYEIKLEQPALDAFIVEADKTRISQAVDALLSNSIKYRDPMKNLVKINVSVEKRGDEALIKVVDNGIGINPSDISKLGKKFVRLNPKTNGDLKRPGGTGLGLFVVNGIMQYHNGKLIIKSDGLGKGSEFILNFPITNK